MERYDAHDGNIEAFSALLIVPDVYGHGTLLCKDPNFYSRDGKEGGPDIICKSCEHRALFTPT